MDRDRARVEILKHLLERVGQIVRFEKLQRIAAPFDPVLLIQELQRNDGWLILSGQVVLDMCEAGEIPPDAPGVPSPAEIDPHDVILLDDKPDPDAPRRWRQAAELRMEAAPPR